MLNTINQFFYGNGNWKYTIGAAILVLLIYIIPKLVKFFKSVKETNKRKP